MKARVTKDPADFCNMYTKCGNVDFLDTKIFIQALAEKSRVIAAVGRNTSIVAGKQKGVTKMREILFRGFHPCENGDKTVYVEGTAVKGKWIYWNQFGELTEPLLDDYNMHSHVIEQDVIPSTVGQYINKDDKNGVKIFEWDVLQYEFFNILPKYSKYTVVYNNECAEFIGKGHIKQNSETLSRTKYCAIIGNTHEEDRDERLD